MSTLVLLSFSFLIIIYWMLPLKFLYTLIDVAYSVTSLFLVKQNARKDVSSVLFLPPYTILFLDSKITTVTDFLFGECVTNLYSCV